ncbi:MAG: SGNH/GDSL hydrolase family protein [bacterium]|nr:SGNH/GDSL hydrolase family protein [bacterium]
MTGPLTKPAAEVYAVTTSGGAPRGPDNGEALTYHVEIEAKVESLESIVSTGAKAPIAVKAIATANVALATGLENGDTVGGVVVATGDLVVLPIQTAGAENGLYTVVASGAASRTTGYTTEEALLGATFYALAGTNAGQVWAVRNTAITVGSTSISITYAYTFASLSDGSVTSAKMANMAQGTTKGRAAGAGTGVPTDRTDAQLKTDMAFVKADVGLGNVDNTSNVTERAATATLTNKTLTSPVITTPTGIVKGDVGLGDVMTKGADIASASSIDLGAATGDTVDITGTTTITALGTVTAGKRRWVRFAGILTLTHNATSLVLPDKQNIVTEAGDTALFESRGSGNWKCLVYTRRAFTKTSAKINLFDKTVVKTGFKMTISGVEQADALYVTSDFIAVDPNTYYSRRKATSYVAFFDQNKTAIALAGVITRVFKTPATAFFIRVSVLLAEIDTAMVMRGLDQPTDYVAFAAAKMVEDVVLNKDEVVRVISTGGGRLTHDLFIDERHASFLERSSVNLFDKETAVIGQYPQFSALNFFATTYGSEFIPVSGSTTYAVSEGNYVDQYDANFNYVTGHGTGILSFTTHADTRYLKMAIRSVVLDTFMLVAGASVPGVYVPYHRYTIKDSIIQSAGAAGVGRFDTGKWNVIGDSITEAAYSYWSHMVDPLGITTLRNYGVGGTAIAVRAAPWNLNAMCLRYADMDNDAGLVTVLGGVNDHTSSVVLGATGSSNNTEFNGALNLLLDGLKNKYPVAHIAAFTPFPKASMVNGAGVNLLDFADAIITQCRARSIPCCDLTSGVGPFRPQVLANRDAYTAAGDGLHPTEAMHEIAGKYKMLKFIEQL